MKKISGLAVFICLSASVQLVTAQTVDEIIEKHIAAMGGREKLMTLTSALMTGTFTAISDTMPINIITTKKHLVGSRIDIEANGTSNYQIVTAKEGWIYTPVQGDKEPRPLSAAQFKVSVTELDLHGPFLNYREKANKIEFAGKETVNGNECYKLKVTSPNTNITDYYVDCKLYFIVKTNTKMFQFGALEDVVTTYGDYRQSKDGFWFAYTFINPRGATHYSNIETNVPVDVNIFKKD
jgi:hypothetical protein